MRADTFPSMLTEAYLTRWITVFTLSVVTWLALCGAAINKSKPLFLIYAHLMEVFKDFDALFRTQSGLQLCATGFFYAFEAAKRPEELGLCLLAYAGYLI